MAVFFVGTFVGAFVESGGGCGRPYLRPMVLYYPIWLVLIIPLAVACMVWRLPTLWLRVLRGCVFGLLVAALCGPAVKLPSRSGTVLVLADRSRSMPAHSQSLQKEAIDLLQAEMRGSDRLGVISFGRRPVLEHAPQKGRFGGFAARILKDESSLFDALALAASLLNADEPARVLVLSDGQWTGRDPVESAGRFAAADVSVDYRLLQRSAANDTALDRIDAPERVSPGQSYLMTAWLRLPVGRDLVYELRRGRRVIARGTRALPAGRSRLLFRDQAGEPGTRTYRLSIGPASDDPVPENNTARFLVGVRGERPILCVKSDAAGSALARAFAANKLPVRPVPAAKCTWSLETLSSYSAVVLENVFANDVGQVGMENLAAWVENTGAGLMMTGGKRAYGPGGYFRSALERILPVSMELRQEHRKLSLAIVTALDRSGSMAVSAGAGKTKMDLANLGAVQVLDLLSDMDEFGVVAVDSSPHIIVGLDGVARNRALRGKILGIDSMGGGIFVYEALTAAARMLGKAQAGTRHIVLFADAADSEQPGKYRELIEKLRQANTTVSVIGLGTGSDVDAGLLRDIAERGGGRCFFTSKPDEIPRLFAQDTFAVARNTFIEDPVGVKLTGQFQTLTDLSFGEPPPLGGYNLCYLRPGALLAARTEDEYKAPIVAAWHAGSGRVLCFGGEADGAHTGAFAQWPKAGPFLSSLARWTAGRAGTLPGNTLLRQQVNEGRLAVELHLDPERDAEWFTGTPRVRLLRAEPDAAPASETHAMAWRSPDLLRAEIALHGAETAIATVEVNDQPPVSLAPVCLPYSPEYKPADPGKGRETLERLARGTGGIERVDLAGIWGDLPVKSRYVETAPLLVALAIALFLLEILQRRTGLLGLRRRRATVAAQTEEEQAQQQRARRAWRRRPKPPKAEPAKPAPAAPAAEKEPGEQAPTALDAMRKARRRAKGRGYR